MLILRSLLFNVLFYLNLLLLMMVAMPAFLLPRRAVVAIAKQWGRNSLWLLRVVCRIEVEWRGLDKIPAGPLLIAAKHQSAWETFALLSLFRHPTFILKRELMWLPLFGWCAWRAGMIAVDRSAGKAALADMTQRARAALLEGRQIILFPEGTRSAPGAEARYKTGIAHLYAEGVAPCLPIALNSGLFWPRRKLVRYPGTIVVDILDPIPPGLDKMVFFERVKVTIEEATARLIAEARGAGRADRGDPGAASPPRA